MRRCKVKPPCPKNKPSIFRLNKGTRNQTPCCRATNVFLDYKKSRSPYSYDQYLLDRGQSRRVPFLLQQARAGSRARSPSPSSKSRPLDPVRSSPRKRGRSRSRSPSPKARATSTASRRASQLAQTSARVAKKLAVIPPTRVKPTSAQVAKMLVNRYGGNAERFQDLINEGHADLLVAELGLDETQWRDTGLSYYS